jgi:hypothetical protein
MIRRGRWHRPRNTPPRRNDATLTKETTMTKTTTTPAFSSIARLATAVRFFRALGATEFRTQDLASWAGLSPKVARRIARVNAIELEIAANVDESTGEVLADLPVARIGQRGVLNALAF